MRNKKNNKTIDDYTVAQLLDDFVSDDVPLSDKSVEELNDEEYIRMMLKKDAQRKLIRTKREAQRREPNESRAPPKETIDDDIRKRFFPEVSQASSKRVKTPQPEEAIVDEILDSIVVKDVSDLAAKMKQAVDFVQDEMGTSESEQRLIEALEQYKRPTQSTKKKTDPLMYNENILVLKRCQNCYFSNGDKTVNGSIWCLCSNPDRVTDIESEDDWVINGLNLPCWRPQQE